MKLYEDLIRTEILKDSNSGLKKLNSFIKTDYELHSTMMNIQNVEFLYKMIFESFEELGDFREWKNSKFLDKELDDYIKVEDVLKNFIQDIIENITKSDIIRYYTVYDYMGNYPNEFVNKYINGKNKLEIANLPFCRVIIIELPKFIKSISHQEFKNYLYIKWNDKKLLSFHDIDCEKEDDFSCMLDKFEEKLSFSQLKSEVVPNNKSNNHLNYFYKQRNELNGQGNRSIKFLSSQFDDNDGSMLFAFRTDSTFIDEPKKELINDDLNDGSSKDNISKEYILQLKICDFFDIFYELIEPTDTNFTKEDMKAILELSEEVRIGCDCLSQYWMGSDFYLTQMDAELKPCTIEPKFWNQNHLRPDVCVCKHLLSLLNHISFFLPQMAMSCKKELKNQNLL